MRRRASIQPIVLCGDFNIAPEDRDVHDPDGWREQVLCSTPERERLAALIDWGLSDAYRLFDESAASSPGGTIGVPGCNGTWACGLTTI